MIANLAQLAAVLAMAGFTRVKSEGVPAEVLAEWRAATRARAVSGNASFYDPGLMAGAAAVRGLDLTGYRGGVALMRYGDIGREVWLLIGESETWAGPFLVVDCAQRIHYSGLVSRGRVAELSRSAWLSFGLPNDLVAVVVSFSGPWPSRGRARRR